MPPFWLALTKGSFSLICILSEATRHEHTILSRKENIVTIWSHVA
jgi:hypothetical protein